VYADVAKARFESAVSPITTRQPTIITITMIIITITVTTI
jgi:hypothetical protein